jgi:sec-independent protein translocase protein TatC
MPRPSDEDLFKDSTMTFGEHLDELRSALLKALLALVIGSCVGFYFATTVVDRITVPLKDALERFYLDRAVEDFEARIAEREARGEKIVPELKDPAYVRGLVEQDEMLFEEAYVDPEAILDAIRAKRPDLVGDLKTSSRNTAKPPRKSDLVRIFLWHTVQDDSRIRVVGLASEEPFVIWVKAGVITGFVLASPAIFYFLWEFVAAGLYPHEKRYVRIFLPFSLGLFLAGVVLTYFFVFPKMLEFFFDFYARTGVDPDPRLANWVSLVLVLPIGFGLSFQLPLVMLLLERIGVFTTENYLAQWRMAVLVMAVIAMVITPTGDPYTMLLLLGPLTILYFGGIAMCKWMPALSRAE